ncbi:MAG: hypothetical protein KIT10_07635 [Flavobacteriales bacterium]|nr:hypothetical protein [Flavobacteriales bacterium]
MLVLAAATASAQQEELDLPRSDTLRKGSALNEMMQGGTLEGRFRQYTMFTINDGSLSDYHAQAFGGSLGFSSRRYKNFQFRMSGAYTFDLWSADLTQPDPATGALNRYEVGLFDVTNVRRDNQVAFLQLFQLNYERNDGRTRIIFGKQDLNTPFINAQDGRMHPGIVEGLWGQHRTARGIRYEGGFLYRMNPRSTAEWYSVGNSVGLYPIGRDVEGRPSLYQGNMRTAGIATGGISAPLIGKWHATVWNVFVENAYNTGMLQVERGNREDKWMWSAMAIRQDRVNNGGNAVDSLAYFQDPSSWTFSTRFRMVHGAFRWQANFTRITAHGRYLMPREWGRDPMHTFLPRERNEGYGDLHAATLNLILHTRNGWRVQGDAGLYWLPSPDDFRLNKYNFPSYQQYGFNMQHRFGGGWQGLAIQVVYLVKLPLEMEELTDRERFNKVDMHHGNIILNYAF